MGTLYRSEEMCRCQVFLQTEAAYASVAELGELSLVQFRDLNPDVNAFQRKFVSEVRRCDEMERKLRFLEKEIKKDKVPILDTGENPDAPQPREMIDLEATFEKLENELREVNTNEEMLKKNFLELTELKHILRKTQTFFDEGLVPNQEEIAEMTSGAADEGFLPRSITFEQGSAQLGFVTGVILRERLPAFERLLWRACRGNVFLRQTEITDTLEDPVSGDIVKKCVFIIFFQGDQLKTRVKKICEGFRATLYPCPETPQERREMAIGVMTRIEDLKTVLGQTQDHRHRVLVAAAKNIKIWFTKVCKIKAVYHTLNLFNLDVTQKCLIAECWCPVADLDRIQLALKRGTEESGSSVPSILNRMESDEPPPTYNRTNKFTAGFQNIVDAYGISAYREVNPAPYTIITFPFLFAVMFGDMGHGMLMTLFALFLVIKEKMLISMKIKDEIFNTFFYGRYIILLMGLFAMYTGSIYNDMYSKSFNIFGSGWKDSYSMADLEANEKLVYDPKTTYNNGSYPYGIDPIWNIAENRLNFLNSYKMKISVILGVFQMLFGVVLSLMNYRYFKEPLNIFTQFIPQLLFLCCIFLYLVILIFFKWTHFTVFPYDTGVGVVKDSHCAPSLLIGLIGMVMFNKKQQGFDGPHQCSTAKYYSGQNFLEKLLMLVAVVCVPVMLGAKPYMLYKAHKQKLLQQQSSVRADINNDDAQVIPSVGKQNGAATGHGDSHEEKFDFGDIFIHQAIHTIEFSLGCVSHTASYLRLWALSLAHAQLSEVLWSMIMKKAFVLEGYLGAILVYLIFWAFGTLTICVLVLMEGLSAFLHALRLHWVEFQSKFYAGTGYAFVPFSFDAILEQAQSGTEE